MYTRCPACLTVFRISSADLRAADGQVVCGRCDAQFNALASLSERPEEATVQSPPLSAPTMGSHPESGDADLSQTGAEPLWDVIAKQAADSGPFARSAGGFLDPVPLPEAGEGASTDRDSGEGPGDHDHGTPAEDLAEDLDDVRQEEPTTTSGEDGREADGDEPSASGHEDSGEVPDDLQTATGDDDANDVRAHEAPPAVACEDSADTSLDDESPGTRESDADAPGEGQPDERALDSSDDLHAGSHEHAADESAPEIAEDPGEEVESPEGDDPAERDDEWALTGSSAEADGEKDDDETAGLTEEPASEDSKETFDNPFGGPTGHGDGDQEDEAAATEDGALAEAEAGAVVTSARADDLPGGDGEDSSSVDVDNVFTVDRPESDTHDIDVPEPGEDRIEYGDTGGETSAGQEEPETPEEGSSLPEDEVEAGVAAYDDDGEITLPAGVTVDHDETIPCNDDSEQDVQSAEAGESRILAGSDDDDVAEAAEAAEADEADEADEGDEGDLEAALEAELNALADQAAEEWAVATGVREQVEPSASDEVDIELDDEDAVDIEIDDDSEFTSSVVIDDVSLEAATSGNGEDSVTLADEPAGIEATDEPLPDESAGEGDDSELEFDVPKDRWNEIWDSSETGESASAEASDAPETVILAAEDDATAEPSSPAETLADDELPEAARQAETASGDSRGEPAGRFDDNEAEADDAWNMALPSPRPSDTPGESVGPQAESPGGEPVAPGHPLFETHDTPGPRRSRWWLAAAVLLGLSLGMQWVHYNRSSLLTHPSIGPVLGSVYSVLGVAAEPSWELASFRIIESAGVQDPADPGTLRLSVRFTNSARVPQPFPMLRVTLEDRWGEPVAMRDFSPGEYIASVNADQRLSPGIPTQGSVTIVDPGPTADGYRLDLCYPDGLEGAYCLGDLPGR